MKNKALTFALLATTVIACTSKRTSESSASASDSSSAVANVSPKQASGVKAITDSYLQLKNALADDNGDEAAKAAKTLLDAIGSVDSSGFNTNQRKLYADLQPDLKENAEHISENANRIAHQREHFVLLSSDVSDLLKTFGTGGDTLYVEFCPMANDNKGAIWISEVKDIKNPYMGKTSPTCGSVKEELN